MGKPRTPKGRARVIQERLTHEYPVAECALTHKNAYELLAATILSAQCTDERVNMVTPALFEKYPTPQDMAHANITELESLIHSTGFYRNKAKNLLGMAQQVQEQFGGEVPQSMEELVTLPGVGRKTANVVRSVVFDLPGLPVDTHVTRLSRLLGLTKEKDAVKIEYDLNALIAPAERGDFGLRLILHGRAVCIARRPQCAVCVLQDICPSAGVQNVLKQSQK